MAKPRLKVRKDKLYFMGAVTQSKQIRGRHTGMMGSCYSFFFASNLPCFPTSVSSYSPSGLNLEITSSTNIFLTPEAWVKSLSITPYTHYYCRHHSLLLTSEWTSLWDKCWASSSHSQVDCTLRFMVIKHQPFLPNGEVSERREVWCGFCFIFIA